jgi:succinate dehydrogenase / fumarate reductase cytochrome b subunit
VAKRRADVGTLYRGSSGQWSWLAHRVTGVAITLFLFVHIVDTAVVAWGPEAYERVTSIYHNWFVLLLELGLVGAVLYHALNGVRIMVFDFWPRTVRYMRPISAATTGLFIAAMIPITWIIGGSVLRKLGWL